MAAGFVLRIIHSKHILTVPTAMAVMAGSRWPCWCGERKDSVPVFLSVCPSRLGCGVQLTVSTSLRLPKAEVLMSPTL